MVAYLVWAATVLHFLGFVIPAQPDIENHPAWAILEQFECGDSASDRIIGGTEAAPGQLPWIVRVGYTSSVYENLEWLCGGALLTDRLVITAAHCIRNDSEYVTSHVRAGEHDSRRDPDCRLQVCAPPVQDLRIQRILVHETFNDPVFHNDIALLGLAESAVFNDYVSPLCLPRTEEQLTQLLPGDTLVVAGWGVTNMTTQGMSHVLQYLYIPVLEAQSCSVFSDSIVWGPAMICAGGERHKDACAGDSGGPLTKVFDTLDGPKHVLEGVVSFGPAVCGTSSLPGVYVAVSHYIQWILDHIADRQLWK